ncbi:hypothetical protein [Hymenobacter canadensis]|uniref:Lipoprotein n=1 Tax=Hymenobacter canadensis TaxID=2999067 RepID=A0ABY7LUW6_9BACT|nr:hypothetical protein [Hymenobacter canadensis]WBA43649.1 hypothetical protein O3303_08780 [Hymenobacter canadensis]
MMATKHVLGFLLGCLSVSACQQKPAYLHETGLLVMDKARNDNSFDYFIPCTFNDTLSFGQNVRSIGEHKARHISTGALEFALLNVSWPSTPDSFYVKSSWEQRSYLSAVELTLKRVDDSSENTLNDIDPIKLAGSISVSQFYSGHYRIVRAKKIILIE